MRDGTICIVIAAAAGAGAAFGVFGAFGAFGIGLTHLCLPNIRTVAPCPGRRVGLHIAIVDMTETNDNPNQRKTHLPFNTHTGTRPHTTL